MSEKRLQRYSISVSSKTYERMRAATEGESLARFVDDIMLSALDDPAILSRVLAMCHPRKESRP